MSVPSTHLQEPTKRQARSRLSILSQPVQDGCVHITMAGDLDLASAGRAEAMLHRALDEADSVRCHLGALSFVDLCGLQPLLDATARARREGASLKVTDTPTTLTRILMLLRLEGTLDIEGDRDLARSR